MMSWYCTSTKEELELILRSCTLLPNSRTFVSHAWLISFVWWTTFWSFALGIWVHTKEAERIPLEVLKVLLSGSSS